VELKELVGMRRKHRRRWATARPRRRSSCPGRRASRQGLPMPWRRHGGWRPRGEAG